MGSIARELDRAGIPYMIIGGQAVLLYGEPRLTRDIDITLGIGTDEFPRLLAIAANLGLRPLPEDIKSFVEKTMVLPLLDDATGVRVDLIFSFSPYEHSAIGRVVRVELDGYPISFASPEDVIIHKIIAQRPRDLEDVRAIFLKNPGIDLDYIRKWLSQFEAALPEGGFVEVFEKLVGK